MGWQQRLKQGWRRVYCRHREQSDNIDPGQFSANCIQICNRRQHSYIFALWFDWMFPRCAPDRVKYYISTRFRTAAPWFSHHSGRSRTFALSQILCQMPFWMQPPHLSRSGTLTSPPTHTHTPPWLGLCLLLLSNREGEMLHQRQQQQKTWGWLSAIWRQNFPISSCAAWLPDHFLLPASFHLSSYSLVTSSTTPLTLMLFYWDKILSRIKFFFLRLDLSSRFYWLSSFLGQSKAGDGTKCWL